MKFRNLESLVFIHCAFFSFVCLAQVELDGTLGPKMSLEGPNYQIPSELGTTVGNNLFHSFSDFNLWSNQSATFSGPNSIVNILARVTGKNHSSIDGLLKSTIPDANLFFANPNGVVFGPNAQIDIGGSLVVSTSDYIRLEDGGRFDVSNPGASILTSAPPVAFGYLEKNTAKAITIAVQGDFESTFEPSVLTVNEGKSVTLIGGDVRILNGKVLVPSGSVNIVATGSAGEVIFDPTDMESNIELQSFTQLGEIKMTLSEVSVSEGAGRISVVGENLVIDKAIIQETNESTEHGKGIDISLNAELQIKGGGGILTTSKSSGDGGDIRIEAETVRIDRQNSGEIISGIVTDSVGVGEGGDIAIVADNIIIAGETVDGFTGVFTNSRGFDDGGALSVNARKFNIVGKPVPNRQTTNFSPIKTLTDGAVDPRPPISMIGIGTNTVNSGGGGDLFVEVREKIDIRREEPDADIGVIGIFTNTSGAADGGNLTVSDGEGLTDSGEISIHGAFVDGLTAIGTFSDSPSASTGNLDIDVDEIRLNSGGKIGSRSAGLGSAGNVLVEATDVTVDGRKKDFKVTGTGFGFNSESLRADGTVGGITLNVANRLSLINTGAVSTNSGKMSGVGSISVNAGEIYIDGQEDAGRKTPTGIFSFSRNQFSGQEVVQIGDVNVNVENTVEIRRAGVISTITEGSRDAQMLRVKARDIIIDGEDEFETGIATDNRNATAIGSAGDLIVTVENSLTIQGGGRISALNSGLSDAGGVVITAGEKIQLITGTISAEAQRDGGSITLTAPDRITLVNSEITASAGNNGGNISIDPLFVILDKSRITANAVNGAGGNIRIRAEVFLPSSDSIIDASSQFGVDGNIEVTSPESDIIGSSVPLGHELLETHPDLHDGCVAKLPGDFSNFTRVGRGGISTYPGDYKTGFIPECPTHNSTEPTEVNH